MIIISPCNLVISKRQSKTFKTSVKVSEDHSIGREVNQRSERKNTTNNSKNCLESDVVVFCLKQNKIQKYNVKINYLPKGINKDYNVIITGKKLLLPTKWLWCTMIWRNKKANNRSWQRLQIRMFCGYTKKHYKLRAVNLNRQRNIKYWSKNNSINIIGS